MSNNRVNDYEGAEWVKDPLKVAIETAKKFAKTQEGKQKRTVEEGKDEDAWTDALKAARGG